MGAAIRTSNRSCKKGMYLTCRKRKNWTMGEEIRGTKHVFGLRRHGRRDDWAHRARNFPDGLSTCMDASPSPNELVLCCCFVFFVVVPCTYVAYIIILIEEAWKRATN